MLLEDGQLEWRAGPQSSDPLSLLRRLYPADHPVGRFGTADPASVGSLDQAALSAPLYLRPLAPELAVAGPWAMPWISARLRRPDGCPWDREQTHRSLRQHLLEEGDGAAVPKQFTDVLRRDDHRVTPSTKDDG